MKKPNWIEEFEKSVESDPVSAWNSIGDLVRTQSKVNKGDLHFLLPMIHKCAARQHREASIGSSFLISGINRKYFPDLTAEMVLSIAIVSAKRNPVYTIRYFHYFGIHPLVFGDVPLHQLLELAALCTKNPNYFDEFAQKACLNRRTYPDLAADDVTNLLISCAKNDPAATRIYGNFSFYNRIDFPRLGPRNLQKILAECCGPDDPNMKSMLDNWHRSDYFNERGDHLISAEKVFLDWYGSYLTKHAR